MLTDSWSRLCGSPLSYGSKVCSSSLGVVWKSQIVMPKIRQLKVRNEITLKKVYKTSRRWTYYMTFRKRMIIIIKKNCGDCVC